MEDSRAKHILRNGTREDTANKDKTHVAKAKHKKPVRKFFLQSHRILLKVPQSVVGINEIIVS